MKRLFILVILILSVTHVATAQYESMYTPIPLDFLQDNLRSRQQSYDDQQRAECMIIKEAWLSKSSYTKVYDGVKQMNRNVFMVDIVHKKRYSFNVTVKSGKVTKIQSTKEVWNFPTPVNIVNQRATIQIKQTMYYLYFITL